MTTNNESLADACISGSVDHAIQLLTKENFAIPIAWQDADGKELTSPPIFIAIDYAHKGLVEKMLSVYGEAINTVKDGDGDYTPLSWASFTGNLVIVRLLIEKGKATVEEEALSLAREYDHKDVANYLLGKIDFYQHLEGDLDAIMDKACREGDVLKVQQLLDEESYDVTKWQDSEGKYLALSPMYMAVKFGHFNITQIFSEKGFQVELSGVGDVAEPTTESAPEEVSKDS
jgi:hypothetical protein